MSSVKIYNQKHKTYDSVRNPIIEKITKGNKIYYRITGISNSHGNKIGRFASKEERSYHKIHSMRRSLNKKHSVKTSTKRRTISLRKGKKTCTRLGRDSITKCRARRHIKKLSLLNLL